MSTDHIQKLVEEAITALDTGEIKLSAVIRKCIRIARLRNDWINLLWLQREIIDSKNEYERIRAFAEIKLNINEEKFSEFDRYFILMWMKERPAMEFDHKLNPSRSDKVLPFNVEELEINLDGLIDTHNKAVTPPGMTPYDTAYYDDLNMKLRSKLQVQIAHYKSILGGIKNRVYDFLSQTEKQILYGQLYSDLFEKNRQYVELRLGELCPEALSKFVAAYQRSRENDPESWAHSLTSCRRLLKDLADNLYPPREMPVAGADGKTRVLKDDMYIARLWQFVYEKVGHSKSGELLQASVEDIGNRIDKLYDLTNKGIHAEVTDFEVNQCLLQTYILIGDILRIADTQTAIGMEENN